MKVLHICQSADPSIGGSLIVARALAQSQAALGIDAWLIYLYVSDADFEAGDGAKQLFLGIERSRRYSSGIKVLGRALRDQSPDVIHHHDGLLWSRMASARLGLPLVTHGHLGSPKGGRLGLSQLIHRYIMKHTHRLIAISDWVAESWIMSGYPLEKVRLVQNGVDSDCFRPRSQEDRHEQLFNANIEPNNKILLWAGRLDRDTKGLDRLLLVLCNLPSDWCCLIAGDGPDRRWLVDEINAMSNGGHQVIMLGVVDNPEVWFGIADVFLFTSIVEPFGLVLLEAAASELPILSFHCEGGGMTLLRSLSARVIGEVDVPDLEHILLHLEETAPDKKIGRFVEEKFSWERAARQTIGVYQELLEENSVGEI